jgi:hypothetical protein
MPLPAQSLAPENSSQSSSKIASISHSNTRLDAFVALILFICVFAVYFSTLCPTIYTGDDGDFITAMATFGVPHPTGYPLFCLLGRLFLFLIPWGNPAFKINLMTALCGAASAGFLYRFLAVLLAPRGHRYLAATGALIFAFSPTMWQQSLSCEVYSLTACFLALLLLFAAQWQKEPTNNRLLLTLTFVFGLALTNHLTVALLFPAFLLFVLFHRPALFGREWKMLLPMAGVFVLPLSLYLYLPLAAHNASAPVNWGLPSTATAFWEHITGDEFRQLMFQSSSVAFKQAGEYLGYVFDEFGIILLIVAFVGVLSLWNQKGETLDNATGSSVRSVRTECQKKRAIVALLLAIGFITTFYAFNYNIFDIYVYYIPSYMVVSCLISFGISGGIIAFQDWRRISPSERRRVTPLIALVMLMIPILTMSFHYEQSSKSGNYVEDDFTYNILQSAPQNSLIITSSNVTLALWYRRFILKERQDAVPIHQGMMYGLAFWNAWYAKHLYKMYPDIINTYPQQAGVDKKEMVSGRFLITMMQRALQRGVPVIVVPDPRFDGHLTDDKETSRTSFDDQLIEAGMVRVPWGICDRIYLKGQEPSSEEVIAANLKIHPNFRFRGIYDHTWGFADPMQRHIPLRYLEADESLARVAEQVGRFDIALEALDRSLKLNDIPELRSARERCLAKQAKTNNRLKTPS